MYNEQNIIHREHLIVYDRYEKWISRLNKSTSRNNLIYKVNSIFLLAEEVKRNKTENIRGKRRKKKKYVKKGKK